MVFTVPAVVPERRGRRGASTGRGYGLSTEMKSVAEFINKVVEHRNEQAVKEKIREDVIALARGFPFYD